MRVRPAALGALLLVAALPAPAGAILSPPTVFECDGTLATDVFADEIRIGVGSSCAYAADITLHATQEIYISGAFVSHPPGVPRTLTLVSDRDIIITGGVYAASAPDAPDLAVHGTAAAGQQGGSIVVRWGPTGAFTLADGAQLRSGAGGAGGDVTIDASSVSDATANATGGAGGDGGRIVLDGLLVYAYGTIQAGTGGRGGAVTLTGRGATSWTIAGGEGGDSRIETAHPIAAAALEAYGGAFGGSRSARGGNGGDVVSSACAAVVGNGGAGGEGRAGGRGGHASVGELLCRGANGAAGASGCPGEDGADGESGGASVATGGRGGSGLAQGGVGGNASARGNGGGRGGDGGNGSPGCAGGDGGAGGASGAATATGGEGGCAVAGLPGLGGSAGAGAGARGRGGQGGSGDPAGEAGADGAIGPVSVTIGPNGGLC